MYFIQFLEPPRILHQQGLASSDEIQATISIVGPSSDSPCNQHVLVFASVVSADDDDDGPCLAETHQWHPGMKSLRITFDVTNINVIWPARMKVEAGRQDGDTLTNLMESGHKENANNPIFCTARSDLLDPNIEDQAAARTERHFTLSSERLLKVWESLEQTAHQLRPEGIALLAYLDSVIGNGTHAAPELEKKLALAASKRLRIIDFSQDCGLLGIGIAQLIPDCEITIADVPEAEAIVQDNIRQMFAAFSSTVTFEAIGPDQASSWTNSGKPIDLVFVANASYDDDESQSVVQVLAQVLARSPRVITVVTEPEMREKESRIMRTLLENGSTHCSKSQFPPEGSRRPSVDSQAPRFGIDVYKGKDPEARITRRIT